MDPQFAAFLWKKYYHPLREQGIRIGSPAVTSSEAGRAWLRQFLTACDGCKVDFLAVVRSLFTKWSELVCSEKKTPANSTGTVNR